MIAPQLLLAVATTELDSWCRVKELFWQEDETRGLIYLLYRISQTACLITVFFSFLFILAAN